ncbi:metallophosphoesterase [Mucilaginibacter sp.]|uniref:metallophosphoesterase n=1 Tax=Mucilaginibacter sp. TaxID=1882438 RepID=UPI00284AB1E1|nr:metallophosphoesterase [Mucilaginibacter sp.]MDR3696770.1 metallophosphoesterase [Mucilaginibacter sp.]
MRRFFQKTLKKPLIGLAGKFSSRPDQKRVDKALSALHEEIGSGANKNGITIPFNTDTDRFIIFSDQHKGARDGADIFARGEKNYLAALAYYLDNQFFYINLGDSEELWENTFITVKKHNKATFEAEALFLKKKLFIKIFGNHDLYWDNAPLATASLGTIYHQPVDIHEGVILKTAINEHPLQIYMTHGHQGDLQSDGNWFSKWFVSNVWGPFQSYLRINPNTPSTNDEMKTLHNKMMYQWSSKHQNMLLITGHTHQPVFKSLTHLELLYEKFEDAKRANDHQAADQIKKQIINRENRGDKMPDFKGYLDTYFNTGCCCFDDGDITGIEIANGCIRLIKWAYGPQKESTRLVLDESKLADLKLNL